MIKTTSLLIAAALLSPISLPVGAELTKHWPDWIGPVYWVDGEYIQESTPRGALEYRRGFYLERSQMTEVRNPGTINEYRYGAWDTPEGWPSWIGEVEFPVHVEEELSY